MSKAVVLLGVVLLLLQGECAAACAMAACQPRKAPCHSQTKSPVRPDACSHALAAEKAQTAAPAVQPWFNASVEQVTLPALSEVAVTTGATPYAPLPEPPHLILHLRI